MIRIVQLFAKLSVAIHNNKENNDNIMQNEKQEQLEKEEI